jgi:hypothetical protein
MTNREQLKLALDSADDSMINVLNSVLIALKQTMPTSTSTSTSKTDWFANNPLKNTVIYEKDVISPIEEVWDVEQ